MIIAKFWREIFLTATESVGLDPFTNIQCTYHKRRQDHGNLRPQKFGATLYSIGIFGTYDYFVSVLL